MLNNLKNTYLIINTIFLQENQTIKYYCLCYQFLTDFIESLTNDNLILATHSQLQNVQETEVMDLDTVKASSVDRKCNILVVVLQATPPRTIEIKHGHKVGTSVELSLLMVGDQSMFYVTIMLWNDSARWNNHLKIGDLVILKDIVFSRNDGKNIFRSTDDSSIFNFGRPVHPYPEYCTYKSFIIFFCSYFIFCHLLTYVEGSETRLLTTAKG